jgi:hypothetical protein
MKPQQYFLDRCVIDPATNCWNWTGAKTSGYGYLTHQAHNYLAHRCAYETFVAPIPEGLLVRHSCDNRACINPAHLLLGTKADNTADRIERSPRGNKLTPAQVLQIRASRQSRSQLAIKFGVTLVTIGKIINRTTWVHI